MTLLVSTLRSFGPSVVAHDFNASTLEAEAGEGEAVEGMSCMRE